MRSAQRSKASPLSPKPKARASVAKNAASQSPPSRYQRVEPAAHGQRVELLHMAVARRKRLLAHQGIIVFFHLRRHTYHHLGHLAPRLRGHRTIVPLHHMENHVVIARVVVVAVAKPFRADRVYLHIAHHQLSAHLHLGVEEVRPGVRVGQPGVHHLYRHPPRGAQRPQRIQTVLPDVVKQSFHGNCGL